jgi:hypothetical protein
VGSSLWGRVGAGFLGNSLKDIFYVVYSGLENNFPTKFFPKIIDFWVFYQPEGYL